MQQHLGSGGVGFLLLLLLLAATGVVSAVPPSAEESRVFVHDAKHGNVQMGVKSDLCDNGETNLDKDWDGRSGSQLACSPEQQRAFGAASCYGYGAHCSEPVFHLAEPAMPLLHECTSTAIRYDQALPTSGPHRPLWPVWGRYVFVPVQRWLHSVEHGGVVALHHPCAPDSEVAAFAAAVAGCLRRHVIAADGERLKPDLPFALIAYRNKVLLSRFDRPTMRDFIMKYALKGPEKLDSEGQYSLGLLSKAEIVSDYSDSRLCPNRE